jgi:hypothetical protein
MQVGCGNHPSACSDLDITARELRGSGYHAQSCSSKITPWRTFVAKTLKKKIRTLAFAGD